MTYDWSGGRTRRFRRLKLGLALSALVVTLFLAHAFFGLSLQDAG